MYVLIIYGQMGHWHNFTSDVLLPYFYGRINAIKIFTEVNLLKNYLDNEGKWYKNYVMPLTESHMYELHHANIKGFMPRPEVINIFCDKSQFASYVKQNHLENFYPKTYTTPNSSNNQLVIVKPHWGGNSLGCYVTTLNKLNDDIFKTNIAQEYIKSPIEYAGYGVAKEGRIIYSFCYIRNYGDRVYVKGDELDNTTQARIEMDPYHKMILGHFLAPVKFTGAFCVDYKIHNNKLIVFEINARLGGSLGADYNKKDAVDMILNMIKAFE